MSVAEKTVGYLNTTGNPLSAAQIQAMDFVDISLGAVMNKLKAKGIYDDTWDRSWYAPGSNCQGPPGAESKLSWRRCCQTQVLTRALQLPMTKASITIAHKSSPAGLILLTYQKL